MPAEFVAEQGALKGVVLSLSEDKESWTLGRDPDHCDLIVEDSKASRTHAVCRKTAEGYLFENLSTTNPVRRNGHIMTEPALLRDGDTITLGATQFRFYSQGSQLSIEEESEEPFPEEQTIFREMVQPTQAPEVHFDLGEASRFVFKVIAGPNTGAELALETGREYLIGSDTISCDIVLHDLSVSRQHAKISVSEEGVVTLEDLGSRNGAIVNQERVVGKKNISCSTLVTLGTSLFLIIDKEAPSETIAAPLATYEEAQETESESFAYESPPTAPPPPLEPALASGGRGAPFPGMFFVALIILGAIILAGGGMVSLLHVAEVTRVAPDYMQEIHVALKKFPAITFTFNPTTKRLFLVGHVANSVEKSELLYNLHGLSFVTGIDDNVVNDEAVWQEMNILLTQHPQFDGVTMHAPTPGRFALTGYLKTRAQMAALTDYMNLNFVYLDRLQYDIVVEEGIVSETTGVLLQHGFNAVTVDFVGGQLTLTGYLPSTTASAYDALLKQFQEIKGVRIVRSFVVPLSPEQAVVDLNETNRSSYQVMGYSKCGDININVIINGKILMRGDDIDGMTVTSIQPKTIFLEKDGLKYKIEYNK